MISTSINLWTAPSIDDLARWGAVWYGDRLLHRPWRDLAMAPATRVDEPNVAFYGFGWRLEGDLQWHSGESIGFRDVLLRGTITIRVDDKCPVIVLG